MTKYEKYRVILHALQVVSTVLIPITAVIFHEWLKKRRIAKLKLAKYKYKYKYNKPRSEQ